MKRNSRDILNDRILKAAELITLALRVTITLNRTHKLRKIDLRAYRGRPEKKEQIKSMILMGQMQAVGLATQGIIVSGQPIQTESFEKGENIALFKDKSHSHGRL